MKLKELLALAGMLPPSARTRVEHYVASLERAQATAAGGRGKPALAAQKKGSEGELLIYAEIGASWWSEGVTAAQVVEKLDALKGVSKLSVRINSGGGDVWEGKAIGNAIRRFDAAEKVTYVDGIAASAATSIALACPKVVTAVDATWMIHEAAWFAMGWAEDLRAAADVLDLENDIIANTYARKTGKSVAECRTAMAAETWMNAAQALDFGLSDETAGADTEEADAAAPPAPADDRAARDAQGRELRALVRRLDSESRAASRAAATGASPRE